MTLPRSDTPFPCRAPDVDAELFFEETNPARIDSAKAVCRSCPFRDPCLAYALRWQVEGIWGATTLEQRDELRRKHRIVAERLTFGKGAKGWGLEPHGTSAGYRRHFRAGEKPCGPCRDAEQRRQNPENRSNWHGRAS